MSVVGYRARNHPQQVRSAGARPDVDDRATDWEDFNRLHARFAFTVDAAASPRNAKLPRFWAEADDGLAQSWAGERVWCNPPYSHPNLWHWVTKAWRESGSAALIVMLVPANRTEQKWWQELIEPHRDREAGLRTEFLPGRIRFIAPGANGIGPNERPPFGCCLLIWGRDIPPPLPVPPAPLTLFGGEAS
jgi:phage N-6-adenine-methyltransferase